MGEVTISLEKYISLVRMAGRVEAAIQYIKEESFPESKLIIAMLEKRDVQRNRNRIRKGSLR